MSKPEKFEIEWGGKTLSVETEFYAQQANGSCLVRYGDTVVLATATMSEEAKEGLDFFPLTVEFEEKLYAAGRIKGSRFIKKEGRPTDEAILTSRFIDRAIRPLFPKNIRNEVQIVVTCLVFDKENDPDIIGLFAASCALYISDIPWEGPLANIRIGQINNEWIINPTYEAREKSVLDLAFAGTEEKILMVEAGAKEVPDQVVLDAFWFGQKHLKKPIALLEKIRTSVGKEKISFPAKQSEEEKDLEKTKKEVENISRSFIKQKIKEVFFAAPKATKRERRNAKLQLKKDLIAFLQEKEIAKDHWVYGTAILEETLEEEIVQAVLTEEKRVDGRDLTQIRPLTHQVAVFPRVHGSSLFQRGETQVVSFVTLGAPGDEQTLDGMELTGTKRYMHHYNFPPFSVGETKPMRGPGRRDIGHGALAEKALEPVLPTKENFPYTIRVVSEVLGSNGSSSMASTCASSLALMDAGVPIKEPVAGIAMGLASDEQGNWKILTDLQDLEDGSGGMDFKITGTKNGITAIQMDTKTKGLSKEIVEKTFAQAKTGRQTILEEMLKTIARPREDLSPYAPRILTLSISPQKIGEVIGPGGKIINEIISSTGVQSIDIEDDGLVLITSTNAQGAEKAKQWIQDLTREAKVGEIFSAKVTKIMDFGAFAEFLPKQEGLVHISNLAPWRVESVSDIVKVGDLISVKITQIDDLGRINLSMKDAPGNSYPQKPEQISPKEPRKTPLKKFFPQKKHD